MKNVTLHIIFIPLILSSSLNAFAQVTSVNGRFSVNFQKACTSFDIQVNDLSGSTGTVVYNYDYENTGGAAGENFTNTTDTTYNNPGEYLIVQVIQTSMGSNLIDSIRIELLPPDPPEFLIQPCENHRATIEVEPNQYDSLRIFFTASDSVDISVNDDPPIFNYTPGTHEIIVEGLIEDGKKNCGESNQTFRTIDVLQPAQINLVNVLAENTDNGSIEITSSMAPHVLYKLEMATNNSTNFQFVQYMESPGDNTVTVDSLNTADNYYCFRVTAYDACTDTTLYSEVVCSSTIDVSAENNRNVITWNTEVSNFDYYELFNATSGNVNINDPAQQSYIDQSISCAERVCYAIITHFTNGSQSISPINCDTAYTTESPPPIEDVTASFTESGIAVSWDPPDSTEVSFFVVNRNQDGGTLAELGTTDSTRFIDVISAPAPYCYQINYQDLCDNLSEPGVIACPIFLERVINQFGAQMLEWSAYSGWDSGVSHYLVEKYDEEGNLIGTEDVGNNLQYEVASEEQIIIYQIRAISNDLSHESISNPVRITFTATAFFPNAFTPNNDSNNDYFQVKGAFLDTIDLKIFNRWGELIYQTNRLDDQGWDGTYLGNEAPEGTYIFSAEMTDRLGNQISRSGSVFLIRK